MNGQHHIKFISNQFYLGISTCEFLVCFCLGFGVFRSLIGKEMLYKRVVSKEMHGTQYLQNRTPEIWESVTVLQCSLSSLE